MDELMILDGGIGHELTERAGRATPLWSTQALVDDPGLVRQLHDDYFAAGADVATTNTYACLRSQMDDAGIATRVDELNDLACRLAVEARDNAGRGLVAGSLGPIGFSYRPDLAPPAREAAAIYAPIAEIHARHVDRHLLETMGSVDEARGGLMGCHDTGKPVWLGMAVDERDGSRLRSGEPLTDVMPLLHEYGVEALLVNCSPPEAVTQALRSLPELECRVGGYANGFVTINDAFLSTEVTTEVLDTRHDFSPADYIDHARDWVDAGATMIGGCCAVSPAHIAHLRQEL